MRDLPDHFVDSRDFARIASAIAYIDANFRRQPRLEEISAHVGLSEFHFSRLFRRWAGITPKQYLTFVTGCAARSALLAKQAPVLDAAYSLGLSGPGRLHDLVVVLDAMTPGELKQRGAGVKIEHGLSDTPFGRALIASTPRGICHLTFVEPGEEASALAELRATWPYADFVRNDDRARATALRIWGGSHRPGASLRLAVAGTNFQLKVWQALLELGARGCTSYEALARAVGADRGSRAIGNALGANPVGWLIPCHHVLRKSGALGGYRWGEPRKHAMLAWELLRQGPRDPASSPPPDEPAMRTRASGHRESAAPGDRRNGHEQGRARRAQRPAPPVPG